MIDTHLHLYAPEVNRDPAAWGKARGEAAWLRAVAPEQQPSLQGWAGVDELLRAMDAASIERGILLGWYWENHDTCVEQNAWFARWTRQHPDRIGAMAAAQPAAGAACIEEVRIRLEQGFLGVGEIEATTQGFCWQSPEWEQLLGLLEAHDLPVNIHVSDPIRAARVPSLPVTDLAALVAMVERFPQNNFILAHWGGGLPFFALNRATARALNNVYYDTAATPLLYRDEVYRLAVDAVGAGRILFGSDYPLRLNPSGPAEPSFHPAVEQFNRASLTAAEKNRIGSENACRLWGRSKGWPK